jgi:hypothetical protein
MAHQVFKDAVFIGGQRQRLLIQGRLLAIEVQQQRPGDNGRWVKPLERRNKAFMRASSSSNWNGLTT